MVDILGTAQFVTGKSRKVHINTNKITGSIEIFSGNAMSHWLHDSPIDFSKLNEREFLNFLFFLHSVSFCYWSDTKWTVEYRGSSYHGAWGMIAAIMRAIDEGKPILDSEYLSKINLEDYSEILRGNVDIPLIKERWQITREVANALLADFDGNFANLINYANGDALTLLGLIIKLCPSFEDSSQYGGKTIYFYKRAQLLVGDTSQHFMDRGGNNFNNIDQLTASADYKLPQVLQRIGILSYSNDLQEKILSKICVPHNSPEEVEIRANTIMAIEMIKQELKIHGKNISSETISNHVWLMGKDRNINILPHHRTITTAY